MQLLLRHRQGGVKSGLSAKEHYCHRHFMEDLSPSHDLNNKYLHAGLNVFHILPILR